MKHGHMMMAMLLVALFLFQVVMIFSAKTKPTTPKPLKIGSHIMYALVILTGVMTAMPLFQAHAVPHWLYAKLILLVVAISATIKAIRPATPLNQSKAGMIIAMIAYLGILFLAFAKPINLF